MILNDMICIIIKVINIIKFQEALWPSTSGKPYMILTTRTIVAIVVMIITKIKMRIDIHQIMMMITLTQQARLFQIKHTNKLIP